MMETGIIITALATSVLALFASFTATRVARMMPRDLVLKSKEGQKIRIAIPTGSSEAKALLAINEAISLLRPSGTSPEPAGKINRITEIRSSKETTWYPNEARIGFDYYSCYHVRDAHPRAVGEKLRKNRQLQDRNVTKVTCDNRRHDSELTYRSMKRNCSPLIFMRL